VIPRRLGSRGAAYRKGKVLMGFNGSDDGVRGALVAYDAASGKEAWRFWTVPAIRRSHLKVSRWRWRPNVVWKDWWRIGGGDAWNAITYDEPTGLVIFGTAGLAWTMGNCRLLKCRATSSLRMRYRVECRYGRICLAFPDECTGVANGK